MPLLISDEQLQQAGLTEQDARLELACRLFDANRLTLHQAATWVGLDRVGMESELLSRGISVYRFHDEDAAIELAAARRIGSGQWISSSVTRLPFGHWSGLGY